ncbi:MAG TPA: MarR family winged helix-turn-helix transcriptional regulator [Bacteroidota bacterium]
MKNPKAIKEIRAFNRFYTNIIGVVDRHILDSPYSLTEVRILYEIYHDVHATARTIKRFLRVDEGYLSRTIDALVKRGLVLRNQSEKDGREFVLSLTGKGKREFLTLNRRSEEAVGSMIKHLSRGQVDRLLAMLRTVRTLLTEGPKNDGNP